MEKKNLPNAVAVLVLGICSIVFGCVFAGLACGIIGIILGIKGKKAYNATPEEYNNYGLLNAGYIMSIIGTILGAIYIIYYIVVVIIVGSAMWFSALTQ